MPEKHLEILKRSPNAYLVITPDLTIVGANQAYLDVTTMTPDDYGKPLFKVFANKPDDPSSAPLIASIKSVFDTHLPHIMSPHHRYLLRNKNGEWEEHFYNAKNAPILNTEGEVTGVIHAVTDTTEMVREIKRIVAEKEAAQLAKQEATHRLRNTMATVQAIARQSLRDEDGGVAVFMARLLALAEAHNILIAENWRGANMADAIHRACEPFDHCGNIELNGPDVKLPPKTTLAISLMIHELCTNATKYGALSVPDGHVLVRWRGSAAGVVMIWRECGGPPVIPPTRQGFGSRLLASALGTSGEVELDWRPEGLVCTAWINDT